MVLPTSFPATYDFYENDELLAEVGDYVNMMRTNRRAGNVADNKVLSERLRLLEAEMRRRGQLSDERAATLIAASLGIVMALDREELIIQWRLVHCSAAETPDCQELQTIQSRLDGYVASMAEQIRLITSGSRAVMSLQQVLAAQRESVELHERARRIREPTALAGTPGWWDAAYKNASRALDILLDPFRGWAAIITGLYEYMSSYRRAQDVSMAAAAAAKQHLPAAYFDAKGKNFVSSLAEQLFIGWIKAAKIVYGALVLVPLAIVRSPLEAPRLVARFLYKYIGRIGITLTAYGTAAGLSLVPYAIENALGKDWNPWLAIVRPAAHFVRAVLAMEPVTGTVHVGMVLFYCAVGWAWWSHGTTWYEAEARRLLAADMREQEGVTDEAAVDRRWYTDELTRLRYEKRANARTWRHHLSVCNMALACMAMLPYADTLIAISDHLYPDDQTLPALNGAMMANVGFIAWTQFLRSGLTATGIPSLREYAKENFAVSPPHSAKADILRVMLPPDDALMERIDVDTIANIASGTFPGMTKDMKFQWRDVLKLKYGFKGSPEEIFVDMMKREQAEPGFLNAMLGDVAYLLAKLRPMPYVRETPLLAITAGDVDDMTLDLPSGMFTSVPEARLFFTQTSFAVCHVNENAQGAGIAIPEASTATLTVSDGRTVVITKELLDEALSDRTGDLLDACVDLVGQCKEIRELQAATEDNLSPVEVTADEIKYAKDGFDASIKAAKAIATTGVDAGVAVTTKGAAFAIHKGWEMVWWGVKELVIQLAEKMFGKWAPFVLPVGAGVVMVAYGTMDIVRYQPSTAAARKNRA